MKVKLTDILEVIAFTDDNSNYFLERLPEKSSG